MRLEDASKQSAHELEVIDAVVRGGGEARPDDAELVDFALMVRSARPLPDHGTVARLDERFEEVAQPRRGKKYPARQLAAVFVCLLLVGGVVAADQVRRATEPVEPVLKTVPGPRQVAAGNQRARQDSARAPSDKALFETKSGEAVAAAQDKLSPLDTRADFATGYSLRKQERSASLALVTTPGRFDRAADRVAEIAHDAHGYVQTARTRVADHDRARGTFLLMIPVSGYRDAMSELTRLGHVRSQSEAAQDITAEYDSAERALTSRRARSDALEKQLSQTTDPVARAALKGRLAQARVAEARAARTARSTRWRSNYVPVDLRLGVARGAAEADSGPIAKAFDRAGEILEKLLAALIVVLAVFAPIAVVTAAIWWVARRFRRGRADAAVAAAAAQPE